MRSRYCEGGRAVGRCEVDRRERCGRQPAGEPFFRAFERRFKTRGTDRLQQIIHGVNFKGANRKRVIRRNKDDGHARADQLEHFEAVEFWHLDVQK